MNRILQTVNSDFMCAEEIRLYCKYTAKEAREIEFFETIEQIFEGKITYWPEYLAKKLGGVTYNDLQEKKLLFNDLQILKYDLVCILKEGSIFGELALIYNQPRLATVVCLTRSEMCLMNQDSFRKTLGTIQRQEDRVKIEFIEKEVLISREYSMLAHTIGINFTKRIVKKGERLLNQGEIPEKVFIVRDGQVRIWKYDLAKIEPTKEKKGENLQELKRSLVRVPASHKMKELAIVGRAQIIGEEGLFTGETRQYTATADTESTVYEINNERFLVVCDNNFMIKNMMEELIDKKRRILRILEARAIKASKRFNVLAATLMAHKNSLPAKIFEVQSAKGSQTQSSTPSLGKKSFEDLFSRATFKGQEKVKKIQQLRLERKTDDNLEDIDKAIISMKEDLDKARKQNKKLMIEKYQRRKPSDLGSIFSKAMSKQSEKSQIAGGGSHNISKEDCNIINLVQEYKSMAVNVNTDLTNFKKSFSIVCHSNPPPMVINPITSQRLSRMRTQIQQAKERLPSGSSGYLGLHTRSKSTHALLTQVNLTDRNKDYESSVTSVEPILALKITSLRRLPKQVPQSH